MSAFHPKWILPRLLLRLLGPRLEVCINFVSLTRREVGEPSSGHTDHEFVKLAIAGRDAFGQELVELFTIVATGNIQVRRAFATLKLGSVTFRAGHPRNVATQRIPRPEINRPDCSGFP